jgi:hypothetical protein
MRSDPVGVATWLLCLRDLGLAGLVFDRRGRRGSHGVASAARGGQKSDTSQDTDLALEHPFRI